MIFVSIQLNSNRPDQITRFFDSVEHTADTPEEVEILLHIDEGDTAMEELVEREKATRRFVLRTLQTDIVKGYATLWKPLNPLLGMTDPSAYFLINLSDEMLFETKGWDTMLKPYVNYYPDNIFRLRASKYRFRNYTDFWECGFAPDSLAFYTRNWLIPQGDWNPCLGPDSFQQCVAYRLYRSDPFSHRQFNRDIPLPFMQFSGEGASIGLSGRALYRRMCINNRAWFTLMSHKMQQEAKRRAMRMKADMVAFSHGNAESCENLKRKCFEVRDKASGAMVETMPYRLSWLGINIINLLRAPMVLYFAGGGRGTIRRSPFTSATLMMASFAPRGEALLEFAFRQRDNVNHVRGRYRDARNHIRGVRKEHGLRASTLTFIRSCLVVAFLMLPGMRRHKRKIKNFIKGKRSVCNELPAPQENSYCIDMANHFTGMRQEHGLWYAIKKLPQHFLLQCCPKPLLKPLCGFKRCLRKRP